MVLTVDVESQWVSFGDNYLSASHLYTLVDSHYYASIIIELYFIVLKK